MKIIIELTPAQEKFLRQFAERQDEGAEDNLGTRKPLHLVQTTEPNGEYRTVAYFWTLAEARRYKEYQSHNLTKPRTFTVGCGYSNYGDYEPFFDLLMAAGKQVIDLQDKGLHVLPGFESEIKAMDEANSVLIDTERMLNNQNVGIDALDYKLKKANNQITYDIDTAIKYLRLAKSDLLTKKYSCLFIQKTVDLLNSLEY